MKHDYPWSNPPLRRTIKNEESKNMPNYYQNKETGELISYDPRTGKVSEFREITLLEVTLTEKPDQRGRKAGGGVEHHNRKKVCHAEKIHPAGKAKGNRECVDCGKIVPPGKYLCKGKCSACYAKDLYLRKHSGKDKSEPRVNEYECIDCGEEIKSVLDIDHINCPKNINHTVVQK